MGGRAGDARGDAATPAEASPPASAAAGPSPMPVPPAGRVARRAVRRGLLWMALFALAVAGFSLALARGGGLVAPVGRPAPPFALPDLGGRLTPLSRFRGTAVVLRFGSVTCTVCDPPWAQLAAWQRAAGPGVRLVDVEVGQPISVVRLALAPVHPPVPVLVDPSGGVALAYGVHSLPSFAFIDRRGRLLAVVPVLTRTGLWPPATWRHYLRLLAAADGGRGTR
jgi:peroxiredoxin